MYVIFNKIIQSHCRLRSLACSYEFYYADICRVRIHTYYIFDFKKNINYKCNYNDFSIRQLELKACPSIQVYDLLKFIILVIIKFQDTNMHVYL